MAQLEQDFVINCKESFVLLPWNTRSSSSHITWSNLISVQYGNSLFITQWNKYQMTVFQLNEREVKDVTFATLKSASLLCQGVKFSEPVLQVFEWSGKLFFVTTTGFLKVLTFDENSIRFLKNGNGCFMTILSVPPSKKILKACPLNRNVLLIANDLYGCISLDVYSVDNSMDDIEINLVESVPLENFEAQDKNPSVVMCLCDAEIVSHLMGSQNENYLVMLVGLHTGSVYWIPFMKNVPVVPKARKLYHAGRRVREMLCPKEGNNEVFILLEDGVVVLVRSIKIDGGNTAQPTNNAKTLKFDIIALPGYIQSFCIPANSKNILCSDGVQCWLVRNVPDKAVTTTLPIKGVTGLLTILRSNFCLATTKHEAYYVVNAGYDFDTCSNKIESIQTCCDLETPYQYICELKEQTNVLIQVENSLKVEDSVLAGVSAAARGNILREYFSGRLQIDKADTPDPFDERINQMPIDTTYKLTFEVKNNSNFEFPAGLWNVSISVLTRHEGILNKTVPLQSSLVRASSFSAHVFINLQKKDLTLDPRVLVNLVAELPEPDQGRWISIPVIEENLDFSYFLTVINNLDKGASKPIAMPVVNQINNLVRKVSNERSRAVSYSIHIPQPLRNVFDLMQNLLAKCEHRCEEFLRQLKGKGIIFLMSHGNIASEDDWEFLILEKQ